MHQHPRRTSITALFALATLAVATAIPASAEIEYPYCLVPSQFTGGSCSYASYEQCAATALGNVGFCTPNPRYKPPPSPRQSRSKN
jgi:hypothetical protein